MRRELGKYRLLAEIGRGGMGEVYLAMSHGIAGFKKLVVLKCMHPTSADEEHLRTMFLDEAMLAARLSHHNVVQTYEAGEVDGAPYIAMEYLEGQPLSRLMRASLSQRMAAHIMSEALAGLHYAHQLKDFDGTPLAIVHRDLSPPNIFVTYDGVVKVVDFGIAKTSLASRAKTDAGMFKGKISYMAPEQAMHDDVDHRADIFSAGAVLWELVAGKRLFREVSPALTLKRLLHDEIPALSAEVPDVDPELEAIVKRALERNPDARYPSAQQMRQDLEQFVRRGAPANWDAELAAFMSEKFARQRQKVQQQIQLCMSQPYESQQGLPTVNLADTVTGKSGMRFVPVTLHTTTLTTSAVMESTATVMDRTSTVVEPISNISDTGSSPQASALDLLAVPQGSVAEPPRPGAQRARIAVLIGAVVISAAAAASVMFSSSERAATATASASAQAAANASGSLEVVSSPPGAMIFVNGEPSGLVTPAVLKGLTSGRSVTVRLDKAGYQAIEEQIAIAQGRTTSRSFQLVESDGVVRLVGGPKSARVYVDDVAVSESADQPISIPVGSRRVRVETEGNLIFSRIVEVVPGEQTIEIANSQGVR